MVSCHRSLPAGPLTDRPGDAGAPLSVSGSTVWASGADVTVTPPELSTVNTAKRYVCPCSRAGPAPVVSSWVCNLLRSSVCGVVDPSLTKSSTCVPSPYGDIGASGITVPTTMISSPATDGGTTLRLTAAGSAVAVSVAALSVKDTVDSDGAVASSPPASYDDRSEVSGVPRSVPSSRTAKVPSMPGSAAAVLPSGCTAMTPWGQAPT